MKMGSRQLSATCDRTVFEDLVNRASQEVAIDRTLAAQRFSAGIGRVSTSAAPDSERR